MRIDDLQVGDESAREQRCEAAGDAVAEAIGMPMPGATGPLPDEIARVLTRRPRRKLRPAWPLPRSTTPTQSSRNSPVNSRLMLV